MYILNCLCFKNKYVFVFKKKFNSFEKIIEKIKKKKEKFKL
jgi:hypothetical protein